MIGYVNQRLELGPHHYCIDGDIFCWYPNGEVLSEHAEVVCSLLRLIFRNYGYAFWLVDALHSVPVGYDARRRYVEGLKDVQGALVVAAYRAQIPAKTTGQLTGRALQLKGKADVTNEVFETEADARRHLSEQRSRLSGSGYAAPSK